MRHITLAVMVLSAGALLALDTSAEPRRPTSQRSPVIDAEIIDAGDYYLGLDGQPIRFQRKNNVYLKLDSLGSARQPKQNSATALDPPTSAAFIRNAVDGLIDIQDHRWGKLKIVRATPAKAANALNTLSVSLSAETTLAPVFTSQTGDGEYLILPDILISFQSRSDAQKYKQTLLSRFDMNIKNQMMFSDTNFVLSFNSPIDDYSRVFETTRALAELDYIKWAEPNMLLNLEKSNAPNPNDVLFREQWGLLNWGFNGGFCDANTGVSADIDADDAWNYIEEQKQNQGLVLGPTPIIAIIDDGIQLNHPDLPIWENLAPGTGIPNPDSPGNRCEGDSNGCNFGVFYSNAGRVYNKSDALTIVPPAPQTVNDTHGTRVAGIAAATRNNSIGIAGSAYNAEILPIRLDFDSPMDCTSLVDALSYAAKYADIISNSWRLDASDQITCENSLNDKLTDITNGSADYPRRGTKGTPILFASGNSAAGWRKITVNNMAAGAHEIQLAFHKDNRIASDGGEDAVWIDNLSLPDNSVPGATFFDFEGGMPSGFSIREAANSEIITSGNVTDYNVCSGADTGESPVTGAGQHVYGGGGSAIRLSTSQGNCQYLNISTNFISSGSMSFWVWVSAEPWVLTDLPQLEGDPFRVYVDGVKTSIDLINAAEDAVDDEHNSLNEKAIYYNALEYPASHSAVIAVGASNDGGEGQMEDRAYFSQYGNNLDVLAPGTAIRTTTQNSGYGYLSGTSASTPMVAGIIANMLAINPDLTLSEIKADLHDSADKIGPDTGEFAYSNGFNAYYGYGRANAFKAAKLANAETPPFVEAPELCTDPNPAAADDDFLLLVLPAIISAAIKNP